MINYPFRYDPAHAAIVVVDVQNDFCDPDGALGRAGNDTSAAVDMVPRLNGLLDAARLVGLPVIFIQTIHDETNDSEVWLGRHSDGPDPVAIGTTCRTGSWGAEFYGVAPESGETTVLKYRYSAFAGTNLDVVLKTAGIRSLLFTGVATEVCVESSLRDALFADYWVTLVADCAASYRPDAHAASVSVVERNFGTVVTSTDLTAVWAPAPALAV